MERLAGKCIAAGSCLRSHVCTHKAYAKYPMYSALLGVALWLHAYVPITPEYVEAAVGSLGLRLLLGLMLGAAPVFVLVLGLVGLWRPGRWSLPLSAAGILCSGAVITMVWPIL